MRHKRELTAINRPSETWKIISDRLPIHILWLKNHTHRLCGIADNIKFCTSQLKKLNKRLQFKIKKTVRNTHKKTKPKPTGPSSPVRTAHMSVRMTGYNCGTQYSTEQSDNLPFYPPDNRHSSDCLQEGRMEQITFKGMLIMCKYTRQKLTSLNTQAVKSDITWNFQLG